MLFCTSQHIARARKRLPGTFIAYHHRIFSTCGSVNVFGLSNKPSKCPRLFLGAQNRCIFFSYKLIKAMFKS
jgi:hypothetical protein